MQTGQGVPFVVPLAQEGLASPPPRSSSEAPSKGGVGGVPCHHLGTPHQGSGKGQGFHSSRLGMGFIPASSAFLYIMGRGLVPGLISQSPRYGNARLHWFCISCPPAETPQLWERPRLSWSFKLSQCGREGAGDRTAL